MKIVVDFTGIAANPRPRHIVYLAYSALALSRIGHDVAIRDPEDATNSDHFPPSCKDIPQEHSPANPDLWIADAVAVYNSQISNACMLCPLVAVSRSAYRDIEHIQHKTDMLVSAHHYGDGIYTVPHLPHPPILQHLENAGAITAYIDDKVDVIRDLFQTGLPRVAVGFAGKLAYGRKSIIESFPIKVHTVDSLVPVDYVRWLSVCDIVLDVPGMNEQCYRFAEASMIGRPVATMAGPVKESLSPPLGKSNCVMLNGWEDCNGLMEGLERLEDITIGARKSYLSGWSLWSQMEGLVERVAS